MKTKKKNNSTERDYDFGEKVERKRPQQKMTTAKEVKTYAENIMWMEKK